MADELQKNAEQIVELVRNRWKKGKRPSGKIIGTYKDYGYQEMKRRQNPLAGGNVDLILDGGLNENLVLNYLSGSMYNIFSTDEKAVSIAQRYGLDVYGLTKKEEQMVLETAKNRVFIRIYEDIFR